jgi:hypothetical protein
MVSSGVAGYRSCRTEALSSEDDIKTTSMKRKKKVRGMND